MNYKPPAFFLCRWIVAGFPSYTQTLYIAETGDGILNSLSGGVFHCAPYSTGSFLSNPGPILDYSVLQLWFGLTCSEVSVDFAAPCLEPCRLHGRRFFPTGCQLPSSGVASLSADGGR